MSDSPIVQVKHHRPDLWVETVVIYENAKEQSIIRSVSLKRGFNIIWGESSDQPGEGAALVTLDGHSVGKSSFCRLIRYILGERSYGRNATEVDIQHAFPNGGVAAIVHLKDTRWSVFRPFMEPSDSLAAVDTDIAELLSSTLKDSPYTHFTQALEDSFLHSLPALSSPQHGLGIYRWHHLLSWLTRDQEARFRTLWEWRSSKSDSEVAQLRKAEALCLIRMVLGLYSPEEDELAKKIERLQSRYQEASYRLARQREQLQAQLTREYDALTAILADAGYISEGQESLYGTNGLIEQYTIKLKKDIGKLQAKREVIDDDLADLRANRQELMRVRERFVAGISSTSQTTAEDAIGGEIRKLESHAIKDCWFGNLRIADCKSYQENIQSLREEYIAILAIRKKKQLSDEKRLEAIRKWTAKRLGLEKDLTSLTNRINQQSARRTKADQDIYHLSALIDRIEYHYRTHARLAAALGSGGEIATASENTSRIYIELTTAENRLKSIRAQHTLLQNDLESLFTKVINTILSTDYRGLVILTPEGDMDFRIGEGSGFTGEAVETLALVLADFTSVLWSVEDHGHHPRFLIHDSPREADLGQGIYNQYLLAIRNIMIQLGGAEAPFQYIVTTTSQPPKSLQDDGTVVLSLKAKPPTELLFTRQLGNEPNLFNKEEQAPATP